MRAARPTAPPAAAADVSGAVPGRSASPGVAAGGDLPGGGVHPDGRRRSRLLQYPLSALASGPAERPRPGSAVVAGQGVGCGRARAGEPAGAAAVGGCRGAVRDAATRPRRSEDHRCGSAGAVRCAAPPAGRLDRGLRDRRSSHPTGQILAERVGPSRSPGVGRHRQRAGQGHLGPGAVRPSRLPVVYRDRPAVAGPGRQAVGGRTVAAAPRRRRRPGPRQDQRAGAAVGVPGRADRIADSSRRSWAAATSRASSTGWPTWSRPARSAATAATASAATCGRSWPGSAPWA